MAVRILLAAAVLLLAGCTAQPVSTPTHVTVADLFDEAYVTGAGCESMAHTVVAARRGSAEVWMSAYASGPRIYPVRNELFAAVFERLG